MNHLTFILLLLTLASAAIAIPPHPLAPRTANISELLTVAGVTNGDLCSSFGTLKLNCTTNPTAESVCSGIAADRVLSICAELLGIVTGAV